MPKRKRTKESHDERPMSKLPPAFSQALTKINANHQIVARDRKRDKSNLWLFHSTYAAKKLLDELIGDDEFKLIDATHARIGKNIEIESATLETIVDHEYSSLEAGWVLPMPYPQQVRQFKSDLYFDLTSNDETETTPEDHPRPIKRERTPRATRPDSHISIGDIAKQMNLDPREARAALRKARETKPEWGWAWKTSDVDRIKKVIKKHLK